ncbi:uncharacterized protein LOC133517474 [Cydia pomonella]|uniref:uncharacterized protein LOC133517474 n=1 Tax=Cydia pomonella TaxID=82600 RepID=UPI002ADD70F6|nr:uncharacterized protein LOC133517474 [Cydia pomonella]
MSLDDYQVHNIYRYTRKTYKQNRNCPRDCTLDNSREDGTVDLPENSKEDVDFIDHSPRSDDYALVTPECLYDLDTQRDVTSILHKKCPVITLAQQQLLKVLDETNHMLSLVPEENCRSSNNVIQSIMNERKKYLSHVGAPNLDVEEQRPWMTPAPEPYYNSITSYTHRPPNDGQLTTPPSMQYLEKAIISNSEEIQDGPIWRKGHGLCFLGCGLIRYVCVCKDAILWQNKANFVLGVLTCMVFLTGILFGAATCGTHYGKFNNPILNCIDNYFISDSLSTEETFNCIT